MTSAVRDLYFLPLSSLASLGKETVENGNKIDEAALIPSGTLFLDGFLCRPLRLYRVKLTVAGALEGNVRPPSISFFFWNYCRTAGRLALRFRLPYLASFAQVLII